MNQALLAKLAWMIALKRDSLCMRILRAKYKVKNDWLRKNPPKRASSVWKAIEGAKKLIAKGACYLIGDGTFVNAWIDPWIPWVQGFKPKPKDESIIQNPLMVSQLIDASCCSWKINLLQELFDPTSVQAIIQIQISLTPRPDKLIWVLDQKGDFSVNSAYRASHNQSPSNAPYNVPWQRVWRLRAPEGTKMLLWRIGQNAIPTKENIMLRIGKGDPNCVLCGKNIENCYHLFFKCDGVKALWFASCDGLRSDSIPIFTNEDIVKFIVSPNSFLGVVSSRNKEDNELDSLRMLITLEAIWFMRNQLLHNASHIDIMEASQLIKKRTLEYAKTLSKEKTISKNKSVNGWEVPKDGRIKINVDVAMFENATALAVVARNKNGKVLKFGLKGMNGALQCKLKLQLYIGQSR